MTEQGSAHFVGIESATPGRLLHVYCDESHQTADRYMVIGGVICLRNERPSVLAAIQDYRGKYGMLAELKWTKVSQQKLDAYLALADLVHTQRKHIHYRAIVIDTSEIDHRRYNRNDPELGFYKLMYQFLLHSFGGYLSPRDTCIIHLDQRTTSHYKLSTLWAVLNNGMHKKYPCLAKPVRSIEAADSHKHDLIQVADIVTGAIGFEMNGWDLKPGAKPAKVQLASHIAALAGLADLRHATQERDHWFGVWHFHFRK